MSYSQTGHPLEDQLPASDTESYVSTVFTHLLLAVIILVLFSILVASCVLLCFESPLLTVSFSYYLFLLSAVLCFFK